MHATNDVEVAVKSYNAGDSEAWHYHKIGTEITVILQGEVQMDDKRFGPGDIIVLEPNEGIAFTAITDTVNVVVKIPGASNDKYLEREDSA